MNFIGFFVAFFEWLDISIYTIFPNTILQDTLSTSVSTIHYNTVFFFILSLLMLSKILGSYIFEKLNQDRYKTLLFSSSIIALTGLFQGLLPTYNQIGISSFILFIILTIIKGIAIGGNYNATIIISDSKNNKYFASSFITVGIFTGFLLIEAVQNFYQPIIQNTIYISFKNLNIIKNIFNTINFPYISLWQTLFLISAFYSFIINLTFFLCSKRYNSTLNIIKKTALLLNILAIFEIITKTFLLKDFSIYFYFIFNLLIPINIIYILIKLKNYITIDSSEFLISEEDNISDQKIKIKDYIKLITLILLEGLPFYYIFIFSAILKNNKSLLIIKILITLLTPLFGYYADKNYSQKILKTSCFLIIFSPFLSLFEHFFSIFSYITPVYYSLMFATCYSTLYGYLPIKLKKQNKEEMLGISINIAQAILHFSIPCLSFIFKDNMIYLSIIFKIICSIIGYLSIKIIKDFNAKL